MDFEPIAIVGSGCVLPDALDPSSLWTNVAAGRVSLARVPTGRWRLPPDRAMGTVADSVDRTWSDVGGYVRGFEAAFDPEGFGISAEEIVAVDPVFQWVLHAGRQALREARCDSPHPRAGLVLGNLSFPSSSMARFAERVWLEGLVPGPRPHPRNRFCSGLPAHFAARALGLGAGAFALDAACASSLYAIKLACDRLHDGSADLMLAGAVNCADDLFIHIGFCALGAMSRSGRSRPFDRRADGLVPAEGAAFVALRRLPDAVSAGVPILGVIRGIGLSNDGRRTGLLVPAQDGQERAMRQAYEVAGLPPRTVSLVECHATGTTVGDGVEARALARIFAGCQDVPIGSLKSNFGHPITAAGAAGLLKVLGAIRARVRPPTLGTENPIEDLDGTPLRLLRAVEPWPEPRRAAVSAFGFGGNNAHLIVEEWDGGNAGSRGARCGNPARPHLLPSSADPIAVIALGARVAGGRDAGDLAQALLEGRPQLDPRQSVEVALEGLRFPPRDLEHTHAQQLLVLEAAREAADGLCLPRERTMVLVGMGCDPEVARYGLRWRLPAELNGSFQPPLVASGVVGTMPNIVANRINVQLDLAGPSFSVSAEEASGPVALRLAARALAVGEVDAALVGAVDLSHEPVHQAALQELGLGGPAGDAAVVLVLKRLADARRDSDPIMALLEDSDVPQHTEGGACDVLPSVGAPQDSAGQTGLVVGDAGFDPVQLFGRAHAATGLVAVACATLALHFRFRPRVGGLAESWVGPPVADVTVTTMEASPVRVRLRAGDTAAMRSARQPTGEMLSLPAHPPPIQLTLSEPEAETMGRAPRLPPVLDQGVASGSLVTDNSRAETGACDAFPGAGAPQDTQSSYLRQLSALHQDFLARQAEVHDLFLRLRQQAETVLLQSRAASLDAGSPRKTPRSFDRAQLEKLASGKISELFGSRFAEQDGYRHQTRMPTPPMLLADRVVDIDAEPGSMGTGTIRTETDVQTDSWYLGPDGRMPSALVIEAGQADLLLISWLGVDLLTRGERVYRLLGCEVTYHSSPAIPGETLSYEIHVDGHTQQGDVRLFFFHYDCRVAGQLRLTVRQGQAGFFTEEELAESGGVLWDPASEPPEPRETQGKAPHLSACSRRRFDAEAVRAFAEGRPADCFGPGWELTRAHVRTPRTASGRMHLLDEVPEFDPTGGPWGRGYLLAETSITPNDWYFDGHFKNDPCMPGTLMLEGCLQAMAFYLAGLGFTIEHDGWRFEPVPDQPYRLRCRGQVTPASSRLAYEVFVIEVVEGPQPTLYADLLCTVDGVKAFHARRMGLRLVPDWPLEHWRQLGPPAVQTTGEMVPLPALGGLLGYQEARQVAAVDGFEYGYPSLLAFAWGQPTGIFGSVYAPFDGPRRVARLPGPPYLFMTRITAVDGPAGGMRPGSSVEAEYDLPPHAWYWEQNSTATLPFCVLLEVGLQPCGWLASYVGGTLASQDDLLFRNLDGTGTFLNEVRPDAARPCGTPTPGRSAPSSSVLRTRTELVSVVQDAGIIIQSFVVRCFENDRLLFDVTTRFGFFPTEAFEDQVGLPPSEAEVARLGEPSPFQVDLSQASEHAGMCLPGPMLLMLDRVTGYWSQGGQAGLGRLRAAKDIDPGEWFFKAHFFQDPVQPGSLGVEAMCQLLQFFMIERGLVAGLPSPRFEPLMLRRRLTWKYRGQVVPTDGQIQVEMEITETGEDEHGRYAVAEAWLWVDGKRIYHVSELGMRVAPGSEDGTCDAFPARSVRPGAGVPQDTAIRNRQNPQATLLDPVVDTWLADHAPTWTVPALAMMSMVDQLAAAAATATGERVAGLREVQVRRWLPIPGPVRLRTEVTGSAPAPTVTLLAWRDAATPELSRFEPVATGTVQLGRPGAPPPALSPLEEADEVDSPYTSAALPHGPAYQYLESLRIGAVGSSGVLDAGRGWVPRGQLHQGLLDAATHVIPHAELWRWSPRIGRDRVGYPHRVVTLDIFEPLPDSGEVRVEARFAGFDADNPLLPVVDLQFLRAGRVLAVIRLVETLVPKGRLGMVEPDSRRAFLRERRYTGGLGLSTTEGGLTVLDAEEVRRSDWLTGTVGHAYGLASGERGVDHLARIAVCDHVARLARVHPAEVRLEPDMSGARLAARPLESYPVSVRLDQPGRVSVRSQGAPVRDLSPVREWWRRTLSTGPWWPAEDLWYGLAERFVDNVIYVDPDATAAVRGRSCLYLANHQVGVESLVFMAVVSALAEMPILTVAKAEHRHTWIGRLIHDAFSYPGLTDPGLIAFVDREDPTAVSETFAAAGTEMAAGKSVLVHVDSTRSLSCRQPVRQLSATLVDLALAVGAPIVPVRFARGLPVEPAMRRLEFPLRYGRQDYWIGSPILPEVLAALAYRERKDTVLAALNALGPGPDGDVPTAPEPEFEAQVRDWIERTGATHEDAVMYVTLTERTEPTPAVRLLLDAAKSGRLLVSDDERSRWLGRLAKRLFGPHGPEVVRK